MTTEPTILLSGTDPDLPQNLPPGLKRYTRFREMARGGSGLLQSCFDPVTGRTVAIKSLLPETKRDRNERRRLLREARVTSQLQHPNTVPVYDIGDDEDAGIFFVMKRISGENLFEILKRIARGDQQTIDAYPADRRIEIIVGACQALAYSHSRGVIHRDVKPENIWVGNFGEVILLDWGVAKVWGHADDNVPIRQSVLRPPQSTLDEQEARTSTLTGGGQRPGTPLYMSPEQVDGNRGIDERTDVFSVGVCLYEMLALREPFRGATIDETFENICSREVAPPSERSPDREMPAGVDKIVMRCLEKRPGDRYQVMRELISDLRDLT
ncbi:Serine/threonine-protein kinase PknD [Rubripirellula lacrimiformis]|uniref:Serine/threonine-protein kinase PknD n=1 Tax=Rubripirellula lacrimiformis TaxID=1930273 RepID=A0A517NI55_9BACT|nr:serine/threonine-protein kinase [Rubripirellula lacrimiformis]QDT06816.1 Serine/threonine-protein kinase PknD [Rubripirellula lacrimiformis]